MRFNLKDIILGGAIMLCVLLVLGNTDSSNSRGRYEIATSGIHPDWFVLDTQTGQVWRYLVYADRFDGDKKEIFELETFGTLQSPEHKVIGRTEGRSWLNYNFRPGQQTH